jgi:hypothetical protein
MLGGSLHKCTSCRCCRRHASSRVHNENGFSSGVRAHQSAMVNRRGITGLQKVVEGAAPPNIAQDR